MIWTSKLEQHFSNCSIYSSPLGILVKCRFSSCESGGTENLRFLQAPRSCQCSTNREARLRPQGAQESSLTLFFFFFNAILVCLHSFLFMYICMAVLGLRLCARAFSSCGKRGPLFIAVRGPLFIAVRGPLFIAVRGPLTIAASRCRAQAPDAQAQ